MDTELAFRRHFPAINWLRSFSRYIEVASVWWEKYEPRWMQLRARALKILEDASEIEETARIIGEKALPDEQRLTLLIAEMIREGFLIQNAFHEVDRYCDPEKQVKLLKLIMDFHDAVEPLIRRGIPIERIRALKVVSEIMRVKEEKGVEPIEEMRKRMRREVSSLAGEYGVE